ncbi:MAG: tetratricopeptide repeat protein [bacterium]
MYGETRVKNHFEQGNTYLKEGNYEEAVNEFQYAIKDNPYVPEIYYNLGLAHYRLHKFKESIDAFNRAMELKPYFPEAQYNIGVVYDLDDQPQKAIQAYKNAIKLLPNDAKLYFNLGLVQIKIEHYVEAKKQLTKAIQLDPQLIDAYHNLGYLAELEGDLDLAQSFYKKAISLDQTHMLADYNLKRISAKKIKRMESPIESKQSPLSFEGNLKINMGKDVELGNRENTLLSKEGHGYAYYALPNQRIALFINFGLTSKDFDKAVDGDSSSVDFKRIIGPAYGGGLSFAKVPIKKLKLNVDGKISFLTGKNEGEKTDGYKVNYNWSLYSLEARGTYSDFALTNPYAGIRFSKLDGTFKLGDTSLDVNQSNTIGIFFGAQYHYSKSIDFDARINIIDEMSLAFSIVYIL